MGLQSDHPGRIRHANREEVTAFVMASMLAVCSVLTDGSSAQQHRWSAELAGARAKGAPEVVLELNQDWTVVAYFVDALITEVEVIPKRAMQETQPSGLPEMTSLEVLAALAEINHVRAVGGLVTRGTVGSGSSRSTSYVDRYEAAFVSRVMNGRNAKGLRIHYIQTLTGRVEELGEPGQIAENAYLSTARIDGVWYWITPESSRSLSVGKIQTVSGAAASGRVSQWCRFSWCRK